MSQIEENVTFEGIMRRDEMPDTETAKLQDYRVEAVTKGATYTLIQSLPYDFGIFQVYYRIVEAFDGTLSIGTDANNSRIMADAEFVKTLSKRLVMKSIQIDAGKAIRLFVGPGTTGKIEIRVTGVLYKPSLL